MLRYRLDTALRIFLNCHAELAEALYTHARDHGSASAGSA